MSLENKASIADTETTSPSKKKKKNKKKLSPCDCLLILQELYTMHENELACKISILQTIIYYIIPKDLRSMSTHVDMDTTSIQGIKNIEAFWITQFTLWKTQAYIDVHVIEQLNIELKKL